MIFFRLLDKSNNPSEYYINGLNAQYVSDIKNLNVIVGANNTRKSRFFRQIINTELKVLIESDIDLNQHFNEMADLFEGIGMVTNNEALINFTFNRPPSPSDNFTKLSEYFSRRTSANNTLFVHDIKVIADEIKNGISTVSLDSDVDSLYDSISTYHQLLFVMKDAYERFSTSLLGYSYDIPNDTLENGISFNFPGLNFSDEYLDYAERLSFLDKVSSWISKLVAIKIYPNHQRNIIYIPVLRASRGLSGGSTDIFQKTIKEQHKLREDTKIFIETGLDLYEKIQAARNGHRQERNSFTAFEDFLSTVFFQSRPIDIIAVKGKDNYVKISIGDDNDDIAIHDLGDGIQAVIILLLPIFTAREGSWVFIDEPENHLHPGFQNILMRAISENPPSYKRIYVSLSTPIPTISFPKPCSALWIPKSLCFHVETKIHQISTPLLAMNTAL